MEHPLSFVIAVLVLLTQIDLAILLVWCLTKYRRFPLSAISEHALLLGLVLSLAAMLGSLYYSDILGYEPCKLCWFQRILMYPQVFIYAMALWKKDRSVLPYSFVLSVLGACVALYHYLLQMGFATGSTCDVVGYSVSCASVWDPRFGYMTIPMMALTTFVALAVASGVGYLFKTKEA